MCSGNYGFFGETMDLIVQYWPQLVALVLATTWMVRLEGRINTNGKLIDNLRTSRKEDLDAAREAREATNSRLDRLDTKLDSIFSEIRGDLKLLFTKGTHE